MKIVKVVSIVLACMLICVSGCGVKKEVDSALSVADVLTPGDVSVNDVSETEAEAPEEVVDEEEPVSDTEVPEDVPQILSYEIGDDGWVYYALGEIEVEPYYDVYNCDGIYKVLPGNSDPELVVEWGYPGNIGGWQFAVADGWVYYGGYPLLRINAEGKKEVVVPGGSDMPDGDRFDGVASFQVVDGWVYFRSSAANAEGWNEICKVKCNGTALTYISKSRDYNTTFDRGPYVVGNKVFIISRAYDSENNDIGDDLISFNIGGGQKKTVRQFYDGSRIDGITVDGQNIYYYYVDYSQHRDGSISTRFKLCKMNIDGTGYRVIYKYMSSSIFCVSDGVAYFPERDGFYRLDKGDRDSTKISDEKITQAKISGSWIYYMIDGQKGNLYRMALDGSNVMPIV